MNWNVDPSLHWVTIVKVSCSHLISIQIHFATICTIFFKPVKVGTIQEKTSLDVQLVYIKKIIVL